jgi:hypothetical protein
MVLKERISSVIEGSCIYGVGRMTLYSQSFPVYRLHIQCVLGWACCWLVVLTGQKAFRTCRCIGSLARG